MPAGVAKSKPTPISSIAAMSDDFEERRFRMRGVEYHIRELSIQEYDRLVTNATATKVNGAGEEVEDVDENLLLRLMVEKSLVSPKVVPESTRLVRALEREVRDLHFGFEPIERPNDEGEYPSGKVDDGLSADTEDDDDPNASAG